MEYHSDLYLACIEQREIFPFQRGEHMGIMTLTKEEVKEILQKATRKEIVYDDKTKEYGIKEDVKIRLSWW